MPKTDQINPTAITYARSLLELAEERGQLQEIDSELEGLREILQNNPSLRMFLRDPGVSENERAEMINRVLEGKLSSLLMSFLHITNNHGRLGMLESIADAYDHLLDERLGKIEVDVTVSQRLSNEDLEDVGRRVSASLKKDAVIHQYVDESIIGGMIIRVQDQLIDGSVRTQLRALRERMRHGH